MRVCVVYMFFKIVFWGFMEMNDRINGNIIFKILKNIKYLIGYIYNVYIMLKLFIFLLKGKLLKSLLKLIVVKEKLERN